MCAQPKRFALSGVFRSGCHGVALAALTPQCCLPRGYGPWGARRWLGGLDRLCRARTSEDNKSGSHKHKSSPCLPVGERGMFLTGGGARWEGCCRSRGSCTPSRVLCSAELCIPCKMGTMSVRHGEPGTLCVRWARTSLCHADVTAAPGKGGCSARQGIPEPSQSHPSAFQLQGSRCHVLWHHKTSVLWISCCSEAGIPGCQGGCCVPTEFYTKIKKVLCKNTYQVSVYRKENLTSACRDAYVGTETTRTSPFISQKEGIKTAEQ